MKKVEIIPLAQKKALKRGIKEHWIEETVQNTQQVVEGYGGRKIAHKKIFIDNKEFLLRVVFEETEDLHIVVTAYLTSLIERYWKE